MLLIEVVADSGSNRYNVDSIDYTNNSMLVNVVCTYAGYTNDIGHWYRTVAVPDEKANNCTEFNAKYIREK